MNSIPKNFSSESMKEEVESKINYEQISKGDFSNFPLQQKTIETLKKNEIKSLFPIQYETFLPIYDGKDLIGKDRTGSGKTLAFILPLLERMRKNNTFKNQEIGQKPFIICLLPTRELSIQVGNQFEKFKNYINEYRILLAYGGTEIWPQIDVLKRGVEILIGTPGRILDLLNKDKISLENIKHFILDETDQMLNFGFQNDIEIILDYLVSDLKRNTLKLSDVQFLLFSATIPDWVRNLVKGFMNENYVFIDMIKNSENKTSKTVDHLAAYFSNSEMKLNALNDFLLVYGGYQPKIIIFTERKEEANEVKNKKDLRIHIEVLHGDIIQSKREETYNSFRKGDLKCIVATNVAARGLDIPEVDLIIQMSPPLDADSYIHRAGRTGRAGKSGVCITFYTNKEIDSLYRIENHAKIKFRNVNCPKPNEIKEARNKEFEILFLSVPKLAQSYYESTAEIILNNYNPLEALSRALALLGGNNLEFEEKSILNNFVGFVTYILETKFDICSFSEFWKIIKDNFPHKIIDSIKGMKFLYNNKGIAFDLKLAYTELFDQINLKIIKSDIKFYKATEIPNTKDKDQYNKNSKINSQRSLNSNFESNKNKNLFTSKLEMPCRTRINGNSTLSSRENPMINEKSNLENRKLFISNIPTNLSLIEFKNLLGNYKVFPNDINLPLNSNGGIKGFGFLTFNNENETIDCLDALKNFKISDKRIFVNFAEKNN